MIADNENCNYNFGILPIEVMEMIFEYLTIDDIKEASLACRLWFKASHSPQIIARTKLFIENKISVDDCFVIKNCMRKYSSVQFKSLTFHNQPLLEDANTWKSLATTTKEISFKWCSISEETLFKILDNFLHLSALELDFDIKKELDSNTILIRYVEKLKSLSLMGCCSFNEETYLKICEKTSTIEKLRLETTSFPELFDVTPTIQIFEKLSTSLKSLSLFFYLQSIDLIDCLPKMKNLRLESLLFDTTERIDKAVFKNFVQKMETMIDLDFSPIRLSNSSFIDICTYMPNLKSIRLNECDTITNDGIIGVNKLKKLEKLSISQCHNISNNGIMNGIAKTKNLTMKSILLCDYFSDDTVISISQNLLNLRSLHISTILFISDRCLRTIFEHLRWLRKLSISSLNSESNRSSFEPHEVEQTLIPSSSEEFTISRIKGLRKLYFYGFSNIPGVTMDEISKLTELESLTISEFHNLDGIEQLTNCCNLKSLDLSYCSSISEPTFNLLGNNIKRLKHFKIRQKEKINDEHIETLKINRKGIYVNFIEQ